MSDFIPWSSQPLDDWAAKYAKGKFTDLGGRKTHYVEKGEGEPVIFLHGFLYDCNLWASNIDALASRFKVYALDLWGFGYSTREPLDYGYQLYVDQLLMFMDDQGIEKASLVGQSMGGATAVMFYNRHKERVNKLLLVDPAGLTNPLPLTGKMFNLPKVGEFFMGLKTNAVRKSNLGNFWIHNKDLLTQDYLEEVTRYQKVEGSTEAIMTVMRKDFFDKMEEEIERMAEADVPILIVWGREDKAIPLSTGEKYHGMCSGSRFEVLDNAGHVPNFEQAEKFNQLAMDFLSS
jgi:pimeloyl-ACP methyl ester carboxylesterase